MAGDDALVRLGPRPEVLAIDRPDVAAADRGRTHLDQRLPASRLRNREVAQLDLSITGQQRPTHVLLHHPDRLPRDALNPPCFCKQRDSMRPTTTAPARRPTADDGGSFACWIGEVVVKLGVIVPQGWTGEYAGWDGVRAWNRTLEVAQLADRTGFDSIWVFDHFHTTPDPTDEPVFEAYTTLSALAMATERVGLGQIVTCAGYRNPALLAKMVTTMDVFSGGRMSLGLGAGWKEE